MIKAIIFDFDGLIIDTETTWFYAYKEVLSTFNLELPLDIFLKCVGTDDTAINTFIEDNLGSEALKSIHHLTKKQHRAMMDLVEIRDGVRDYLNEARNLGLKIGLASSSTRDWVEGFLKQLQIFEYFDVIKTGDEVEKVKPDPTLYLNAIHALDIKAEEAIAFEDSANGARAAIAAGLKCVIVPNEVTKEISFDKFHLRINSMGDMQLREVITHLSLT